MPLQTIAKLLFGSTSDPYDEPLTRLGLRRVGRGWMGRIRDLDVHVEASSAALIVYVDLTVPLTLMPPGQAPPTHNTRFDEQFSVPPHQRDWLSERMKSHLVGLSGAGQLTTEGQRLVLRRREATGAANMVRWVERMVRVADDLQDDAATLAELEQLRLGDPEEALRLARRIRGRSRVAPHLRTHADALVRRGRKLLRIVEGPQLPSRARRWAAERLAPRYVDDVVDTLLDRPRTPGDLVVLSTLVRHHEVALLLAHNERFWELELAKGADPGRASAAARLLENLAREEPGPWVDSLVARLPGTVDPLLDRGLRVVAEHGSHRAFIAVSAILEQGVPRAERPAWRRAQGALRARHAGAAGSVSLAVDSGHLALPDDQP